MAIANFIPQVWAAALLEAFHVSEIVAPTCNRDYEGEAAKGNQVNITTITTPTVVDYKAAGRTITAAALADTTVALQINQEKAFAFKVDDVDRVQAAGSFDAVTMDAGAALVEDAESYILAQAVANGTSDNGGAVVLDSSSKAYAAILAMRTSLTKAKVPSSQRYCVVNSDFAALMLAEASKLSSVNTAGSDQTLRNGVIGQFLGFTVLESPLLNAAKPTAIAYHKSAIGYVNQIDKVEALRDTGSFSDIVRSLHVYGAKVLRATAVRVYAGA